MKLLVILAATAAALAGCAASDHGAYAAGDVGMAAAATAPAQACFRLSQVTGQRVIDNRTVLFEARNRDVYRMGMASNCLSGARFDPLVLEVAGGGDVICRPIDVSVKVASSTGVTGSCLPQTLTLMSPDEVAALPPKDRP